MPENNPLNLEDQPEKSQPVDSEQSTQQLVENWQARITKIVEGNNNHDEPLPDITDLTSIEVANKVLKGMKEQIAAFEGKAQKVDESLTEAKKFVEYYTAKLKKLHITLRLAKKSYNLQLKKYLQRPWSEVAPLLGLELDQASDSKGIAHQPVKSQPVDAEQPALQLIKNWVARITHIAEGNNNYDEPLPDITDLDNIEVANKALAGMKKQIAYFEEEIETDNKLLQTVKQVIQELITEQNYLHITLRLAKKSYNLQLKKYLQRPWSEVAPLLGLELDQEDQAKDQEKEPADTEKSNITENKVNRRQFIRSILLGTAVLLATQVRSDIAKVEKTAQAAMQLAKKTQGNFDNSEKDEIVSPEATEQNINAQPTYEGSNVEITNQSTNETPNIEIAEQDSNVTTIEQTEEKLENEKVALPSLESLHGKDDWEKEQIVAQLIQDELAKYKIKKEIMVSGKKYELTIKVPFGENNERGNQKFEGGTKMPPEFYTEKMDKLFNNQEFSDLAEELKRFYDKGEKFMILGDWKSGNSSIYPYELGESEKSKIPKENIPIQSDIDPNEISFEQALHKLAYQIAYLEKLGVDCTGMVFHVAAVALESLGGNLWEEIAKNRNVTPEKARFYIGTIELEESEIRQVDPPTLSNIRVGDILSFVGPDSHKFRHSAIIIGIEQTDGYYIIRCSNNIDWVGTPEERGADARFEIWINADNINTPLDELSQKYWHNSTKNRAFDGDEPLMSLIITDWYTGVRRAEGTQHQPVFRLTQFDNIYAN